MKTKTIHVCTACGATSMQWKGQCPSCGQWNTLEARTQRPLPGRKAVGRAVGPSGAPVPLSAPAPEGDGAFGCGLAALDELLGKGLVPGATVLVAGEPGIGKSTLLLQMAGGLAASGRRAVYVSAEESLPQLRSRAERLNLLRDGLDALDSTSLTDALAVLEGPDAPDMLVVDSVQTMGADGEGLPGSPNQVRAVATVLSEAARKAGTALILVGHVTKDGQIAGPKLLEHMVDTVLSLEGDRRAAFRVIKVLKNRFGPSFEMVVFQMTGAGMEVVADPSTFFLQDRDPSLPGTALVMGVSGQRPFAVEVQALVTRSFLSIPRRTALGFDANRLHLLLAVLEKQLKLNFGQVDIYAKIGGGLKLADPGLDLGIVAAVLSSFYDRPLPEAAAFWGEVDLNGQVRPVHAHDIRSRQAKRLGYGPVFHPAGEGGKGGCPTVAALQARLFGKSGG